MNFGWKNNKHTIIGVEKQRQRSGRWNEIYRKERKKTYFESSFFFKFILTTQKKMITILFVGIYLDGQLVEHGSKGFRFGAEIW